MNRLAGEKSPYLLQHAGNPVDWYPWGAEAFEKARREDRPIFLSIGYSTCHWCHVMARESFADPQVAGLMNETFVSIKVDREERPDIDSLYMKVSQMMTGAGGWPLTILMTPDGKPFHAATYLPRHSRFGQVGLLDLIPRVKQLWGRRRGDLLALSERVARALAQTTSPAAEAETAPLDPAVLEEARRRLEASFDEENGGFGDAPKFPSPHHLLFLLRCWKRTGRERTLAMVEHTLQRMRGGGVYDQLGGGFHRYSTDARWQVPHFEKMLYDQALLTLVYTEAYQATGRPFYGEVAREILDYMLRDMRSADGGFYSAEDADSEGEEGRFYLWSRREIEEVLEPGEARLVLRLYGIREEGNFVDPVNRRRSGANILHQVVPLAELAAETGLSESRLEETMAGARNRLLARRNERVRPQRDDKILTDWNGLAIAALARAAAVLEEPGYADAARRCLDFVRRRLRQPDGRLFHRYRQGEAGVAGQATDYAFLIWGLLELYEQAFDPRDLRLALDLEERFSADFREAGSAGYFLTDGREDLLVRPMEAADGALPSANSVALLNLLRLSAITGRPELVERAAALSRAFSPEVRAYPSGYTLFLSGLDFALGPSLELVIVGPRERGDTRRLVRAFRRRYLPAGVLVLKDTGSDGRKLEELAPYTRDQKPLSDRATAFVCRSHSCAAPTSDVSRMVELLEG